MIGGIPRIRIGAKTNALFQRVIPSWFAAETHQRRSRAVVKTFGYRLLMVVITTMVALAVTGELATAFNIGIATNVIKTGTYYLYERLWDRISWGVTTDP